MVILFSGKEREEEAVVVPTILVKPINVPDVEPVCLFVTVRRFNNEDNKATVVGLSCVGNVVNVLPLALLMPFRTAAFH